jgi:hypothetical protein
VQRLFYKPRDAAAPPRYQLLLPFDFCPLPFALFFFEDPGKERQKWLAKFGIGFLVAALPRSVTPCFMQRLRCAN